MPSLLVGGLKVTDKYHFHVNTTCGGLWNNSHLKSIGNYRNLQAWFIFKPHISATALWMIISVKTDSYHDAYINIKCVVCFSKIFHCHTCSHTVFRCFWAVYFSKLKYSATGFAEISNVLIQYSPQDSSFRAASIPFHIFAYATGDGWNP